MPTRILLAQQVLIPLIDGNDFGAIVKPQPVRIFFTKSKAIGSGGNDTMVLVLYGEDGDDTLDWK